MCREKGAVKHDDRIDALAQGVKYYTEAFALNAHKQIALRRLEEWNDTIEQWQDDPVGSANHIVFGMNIEQRREARGRKSGKTVPTWI